MAGRTLVAAFAFSLLALAGATAEPAWQLAAQKGQTRVECLAKADDPIVLDRCMFPHPLCRQGHKDECEQACRQPLEEKCMKLPG